MTLTTILDLLAGTGTATIHSLWMPVLAWTVLALPLWGVVERTDSLHPHGEYRLLQLLLIALPVGILAASAAELLPESASLGGAVLPTVTVIPSMPEIEATAATSPTWEWVHVVGLFTVSALGLALFRLGQLALDAVAALRVKSDVAPDTDPELNTEVGRLADALDIRRSVQVAVTPEAAVPMTLGGLHPVILLPSDVPKRPDALRTTLVHECVHIRRWDDLAHLVERLVTAIFAVHPVVSRLRRRIARARERACDAAVLGDEHTSTSSYARLLAAFADGTDPERLGVLSLSESPSSLTDRIDAMRAPLSTLLSSRAGLTATLTLVGISLTLGVVACSDSFGPDVSELTSTSVEDTTYMVVEDQPELIGGMEALQKTVTYPDSARKAGVEGRVIVQFVVNKEGAVEDPTVIEGINDELNGAAMEAVKAQEFTPGRQDGEPARVVMSIPVTFKLGDSLPSDGDEPSADRSRAAPGDDVFMVVEDQPELKGGMEAVQEAIDYPETAREAGIEGQVIVQFVVTENGRAEDPKVIRGVHKALNRAAIAAVREQTFEPGHQQGEPVRVQMSLPVKFELSTGGQKTGESADLAPRSGSLEVTDLKVTGDGISGHVLDPDTGLPVAGANVALPSLETGAATAPDGRFRIQLSSDKPDRLVVSHLDYGRRSIRLP